MKNFLFSPSYSNGTSATNHFLRQVVLGFILVFTFSFQAHAIHIWTGAVNNDWHNTGNWNPASIPSSLDFVSIPNFTNIPEVKFGNTAVCSGIEIANDATFKIQANAFVEINASISDAIKNNGILDNSGTILLGAVTAINGQGILNYGLFVNREGGQIHIDRCMGAGINNDNAEIQNFGKLIIGAIANINGYGIKTSDGSFINYTNGDIKIDRTNSIAFWNISGGIFNNYGKVAIGSSGNIGETGFQNNGLFNNRSNSEMVINRATEEAIRNNSPSSFFTNSGKIQIGTIISSGKYGINNSSRLDNEEGEISIDRVGAGIRNDNLGTFTNYAKLVIGPLSGLANYGISNGGVFANNVNGLITIERVSGYGIETDGQTIGSFTNEGKIVIGTNSALFLSGIYNNAAFENKKGGEIQINHVSHAGIQNVSANSRPFKNNGKILIGQTAAAGKYGILNSGGFNNQEFGQINIDRTTLSGIANLTIAANFNNAGKLILGDIASTGTYGIHNGSSFFHNASGSDIDINRATQIGFFNENAQMDNEGSLVIRGNTGDYSFKNTGIFSNEKCSQMILQDAVWNDGKWTNFGFLYIATQSAHTNIVGLGKFFENHGVIQYPAGNPIPNVINYDLISVPVTGNCNALTPALQLGNQLSFTIATTWYTSAFFNTPAGTYNPATNTFIATALTPSLYFVGTDNDNGCLFIVAVNASYQLDLVPPTVVCKNISAALNASGSVVINPAQVYQSGTDNCGVVTPATVSPSSFQCANIGTNSVTLTVNDGNGNNATCVATVNVVDNLAPTVICKPFTAELNAAGVTSITAANIFQSGTDNCGVVNTQPLNNNTFSCANLGNQLVTLVVNDGHGNTASCQATVTVVDKIVPTMICRAVTLNLNAAGQASLTAAQVNNGSFDNCGITASGIDKTTFDCSNIGANTVVLSGIDQSENKGQCMATVTVIDPIKPVALCKNATINLGANGVFTFTGSEINNGSFDNCAFGLSVFPATLSCANIGVNTVGLKATDASGNTGTCTALVTVKDLSAPTATCKNVTLFLNDLGKATLSPAQINNGSTDACGIASMELNRTEFSCGDLAGSAQIVFLTVRDVNNNTSMCSGLVTVKDNLAPTATCDDVTVQLGQNGTVTVFGSALASNSYDNCSIRSYSPTSKIYTTANIGANNLTITVRDWSNNSASCVSVVHVLPYSNLKGSVDERDAKIEVENLSLNLYPNPSSGAGTLKFELAKTQDFTVILYDLSGRILWSEQGTGIEGANTFSIDASHLPSGIYFLDFQSENLKKQIRWGIQN